MENKKLTLVSISFNCPMQKIKKCSNFVWTINNRITESQIERIYKNEFCKDMPKNTFYTIGTKINMCKENEERRKKNN